MALPFIESSMALWPKLVMCNLEIKKDFNAGRVGTGGSDLPDLKEEFNDKKHIRGTCSMARAASPKVPTASFYLLRTSSFS